MTKQDKVKLLGLLFDGTINKTEFNTILSLGLPAPSYVVDETDQRRDGGELYSNELLDLYDRIGESILIIQIKTI